jgi:Protein of unknown function (DUF3293)
VHLYWFISTLIRALAGPLEVRRCLSSSAGFVGRRPVNRYKGKQKMPSDLVLAYRATDYVAFNDSREFLIRIGRHSLVIDELFARMKTSSGVVITAWNPYSKSLSPGANAYWDRELKVYLNARRFAFLAGEGRGEIGEWPPEPSVLRTAISTKCDRIRILR